MWGSSIVTKVWRLGPIAHKRVYPFPASWQPLGCYGCPPPPFIVTSWFAACWFCQGCVGFIRVSATCARVRRSRDGVMCWYGASVPSWLRWLGLDMLLCSHVTMPCFEYALLRGLMPPCGCVLTSLRHAMCWRLHVWSWLPFLKGLPLTSATGGT